MAPALRRDATRLHQRQHLTRPAIGTSRQHWPGELRQLTIVTVAIAPRLATAAIVRVQSKSHQPVQIGGSGARHRLDSLVLKYPIIGAGCATQSLLIAADPAAGGNDHVRESDTEAFPLRP
jgi:hypothetical protein